MIVVPGDMRHPGRILADAGLAELIDMAEPACVILSGVLHFADAGTARDVAAAFAGAIAPGSYLIISVGSGSRSEGDNFTSAYTAARFYIHSPEEIQSFFGGGAPVWKMDTFRGRGPGVEDGHVPRPVPGGVRPAAHSR